MNLGTVYSPWINPESLFFPPLFSLNRLIPSGQLLPGSLRLQLRLQVRASCAPLPVNMIFPPPPCIAPYALQVWFAPFTSPAKSGLISLHRSQQVAPLRDHIFQQNFPLLLARPSKAQLVTPGCLILVWNPITHSVYPPVFFHTRSESHYW